MRLYMVNALSCGETKVKCILKLGQLCLNLGSGKAIVAAGLRGW